MAKRSKSKITIDHTGIDPIDVSDIVISCNAEGEQEVLSNYTDAGKAFTDFQKVLVRQQGNDYKRKERKAAVYAGEAALDTDGNHLNLLHAMISEERRMRDIMESQ